MTAFEMNLNVGGTAFGVPDPEDVKAGHAPSAIDIHLTVIQVLPQQNGQMAGLPLGQVKFTLHRDQAIDFFKTGLEQAEALPPQSKLAIATDLNAAEQMAQDVQSMRNGS